MELLHFMKSRRGGETVGIIVLALGLAMLACLVTYYPDDSSAYYTSTKAHVDNAIGYYGATLAWIFVGFFGAASFLFPLTLLIIGWNRFWGKELEHIHTKLIGFLVLTVALPPTLELLFGSIWFRQALVPSGGYLGIEMTRSVVENFNFAGAAIAFATLLLVGLLLATRISLAALAIGIRNRFAALLREISLRWARTVERRRRDKMKSEVIRKHLDKPLLAIEGEDASIDYEDELSIGPREQGVVVRQVRGHGRFQIRKVTKADLRRVAREIAAAERDVFELYPAGSQSILHRDLDTTDLTPVAEIEPRRTRPPRRPLREAVDEQEERQSAPASRSVARAERKPIAPPERRPEPRRRSSSPRSGGEHLPSLDLLQEPPARAGLNEDLHRKLMETGRLIEEKSREFSVEGEVTAYHPGPVVTTFEFKPSAGVKYAKVVNLADDLSLALKAESMRIERISGSSTVGIEVPNRKREIIALREIIDSDTFLHSSSHLTLALGKDIHGEPVVSDLAKMPHLLVAGATGAGKSVGLNSMIVSLLYKALPSQLRLLMIDPKMVELKIYEDIPHLLHPIITDPKLASTALLWTVNEMENRYRTLSECGVRNIDQYNKLLEDPEGLRRAKRDTNPESEIPPPMQYIVVIIDEFADLMMVASKDVEDSVTRLAQKARAVGIHLIIATQRPSVDVITGVIKANFPARISYQVASKIDSRTILDTQGAEKLLGNGDMLFLPPGTARMRRIHGAYVSESEIHRIVEFVKESQGEPQFVEEITQAPEEKSGADGIEYLNDPKYDEAVRVVLTTGQASASYLQRRLKLGYSRAARLIEIMEANGVVGPSQGSKPREVLVRADDYPPAQEA
jgi:DNA segregation ATPase FtsK/SpoIIIE, S-DNA-T family